MNAALKRGIVVEKEICGYDNGEIYFQESYFRSLASRYFFRIPSGIFRLDLALNYNKRTYDGKLKAFVIATIAEGSPIPTQGALFTRLDFTDVFGKFKRLRNGRVLLACNKAVVNGMALLIDPSSIKNDTDPAFVVLNIKNSKVELKFSNAKEGKKDRRIKLLCMLGIPNPILIDILTKYLGISPNASPDKFIDYLSGVGFVRFDLHTGSHGNTLPEMLSPTLTIFEDDKLTKSVAYINKIEDQCVLHGTIEPSKEPMYAYVDRSAIAFNSGCTKPNISDDCPRLVSIYRAADESVIVLEFQDEQEQFYKEMNTYGFSRCFNDFDSGQKEAILKDPCPALHNKTMFFKLYGDVHSLLTKKIDEHGCILYKDGILYVEHKIQGTYFIITPNGLIVQIELTLDRRGRYYAELKLVKKCSINVTNAQLQLGTLFLEPDCINNFCEVLAIKDREAYISLQYRVEEQMFLYQKDPNNERPWLVVLTLEADGTLTLEPCTRNQQEEYEEQLREAGFRL